METEEIILVNAVVNEFELKLTLEYEETTELNRPGLELMEEYAI